MVLQFGKLPGFDLVDSDGVVKIEIAALEAAEFEHVCTATEPTAKIRADGADVSSFRATDGEIDVWKRKACDVERMDRDFTRLAFDGLSFAGKLVERLAVEFDGGDHGGRLQLWADESGGRFADLGFRDGGAIRRRNHLARTVF